MHVGDPVENKTSKLWQFGPGLQGQNARRKLTDDGKAYVEIMTGTFSNNQPDYSWILPHAVKDAKNYWYPLRDIEMAKNATVDASVTLQMRDANTVFYGFNTTQAFSNAKLVLKYGDQTLVEKTINILYSALLRKLGKTDQALEFVDELLEYDPLNFSAFYEKGLLQGNGSLAQWHNNMQEVDNNYLEIATNYMNAGLLDNGIALLSSLENPSNPLIYYYQAWFYSALGDTIKAAEMLKLAKNTPLWKKKATLRSGTPN